MKKMKYIAALLICAGIANAQVITPTSVVFTGTAEEYAPLSDEIAIIDESGLSATPTVSNLTTVTHTATGSARWTTTDPGGYPSDFYTSTVSTVVFEFDLGSTQTDIDTFVSWPYHPGANNISEVDLYFSTDGGTTASSTQTVAIALTDGYHADLVSITPVTANFITMVVTDNHFDSGDPGYGGDRVGIGEIRFAKNVVIPDPIPEITSFTASPAAVTNGGITTLSWTTVNGDFLSLDQGIGEVTGLSSTQLVITSEITYTLTATNSYGTTNGSVTVTILDPAPEGSFDMDKWYDQATNTAGNVVADNFGYVFDGTAGISDYDYGALDAIDGKPVDGSTIEYIFNFTDAATSTALGSMLGWSPGGEINVLKLEQWEDTGVFGITVPGYWDYNLTTASTWDQDVHVVWRRNNDAGTIDLFVNGVYMETDTNKTNWRQDGGIGTLGVNNTGVDIPTGTMYGVGTYDTALTDAEILALFEALTVVDPPDAVVVAISGPTSGGEQMVLSWAAQDGYDYTVQTNSNLIVANWGAVAVIPGVDGTLNYTNDVSTTEDQVFYRVIGE